MIVLEKPAWMIAVVFPPSSPGPETSFSLILVGSETLIGDQNDAEGVHIVTVAAFAMCSCGTSRKPGTDDH